MKFGIHFELSVARPWTPDDERRVYAETLEHLRLAEDLGFEQAWPVEHHFLEEHSLDRPAFGAPAITVANAISATYAVADVTVAQANAVCRPDIAQGAGGESA